MRLGFWRRLVATLAVLVGLGIAAPVAEASAAPAVTKASVHLPTGGMSPQVDWWW